MKRCRYCRQAEGDLIYQPPSDDYVPGRRNYRARGNGPSYHHLACLAAVYAAEAESQKRWEVENAAMLEEIRQQIAASKLS